MKVLALDYEPSTKRGGQERSLYDILCGLNDRGHTITLCYVIKGNLVDEYKKKGIHTIQVKRFSIINKLSITQWIDFIISLKRIKNVKGNIIYINQIMDLPLAAVLKKTKRAKKLVCHLRLPPMGITLNKRMNQLGIFLPYVDAFIVANKHMFNLHVNHGIPAKKIKIIPNAFVIKNFKKKEFDSFHNNEVLKITFIGRFHKVKGLHTLVDAMIALHKKNIPCQLDIAGTPFNSEELKYQDELLSIIKENHLTGQIRFIGHVEHPINHLEKYHLCIFPSQWDEPFGRVLVESIIAGTPVIARDIGSVKEIIDEHEKEWLFSDTDEMVQKIIYFYKNPQNYPIEKKQVHVKKHFSMDKVLKNIEKTLIE